MVKFEFKQTNQETPPHYCPPALAAGGSAGGTVRLDFNVSATARSR
jgi:hypothetical protein